MIDGDDREGHDQGDLDLKEDASSNEELHGESAETEVDDAPRPVEEEQPAVAMEADSDEGGTLDPQEDAPAPAESPAEEPHKAEAASESEPEPEPQPEAESAPEPEPESEPEALSEPGPAPEPQEPEASAEPQAFADAEGFDGAALDEAEEEPAYDEDDLGLVSDDDALPWLESSDYDDIESVDAWRITGFVVMGLVVLALLVGGFWYYTNRSSDGTPVADGSIIAAPDGPYKERPENPGGKTFERTGDMAPAVAEGETREGRLAEARETPAPAANAPEKAAEETKPTPNVSSASDNRIAVQVGAYRDTATAEAGWRALNRQTDALSGVKYRIVKGEADIGTVYRLQALPGDMAAARALRDALQADGIASQIKQ